MQQSHTNQTKGQESKSYSVPSPTLAAGSIHSLGLAGLNSADAVTSSDRHSKSQILSTARNFAERARGLARTSLADATRGRLVRSSTFRLQPHRQRGVLGGQRQF